MQAGNGPSLGNNDKRNRGHHARRGLLSRAEAAAQGLVMRKQRERLGRGPSVGSEVSPPHLSQFQKTM